MQPEKTPLKDTSTEDQEEFNEFRETVRVPLIEDSGIYASSVVPSKGDEQIMKETMKPTFRSLVKETRPDRMSLDEEPSTQRSDDGNKELGNESKALPTFESFARYEEPSLRVEGFRVNQRPRSTERTVKNPQKDLERLTSTGLAPKQPLREQTQDEDLPLDDVNSNENDNNNNNNNNLNNNNSNNNKNGNGESSEAVHEDQASNKNTFSDSASKGPSNKSHYIWIIVGVVASLVVIAIVVYFTVVKKSNR